MGGQMQNPTECSPLLPRGQPKQKEKQSRVSSLLFKDPQFVVAAVLNIFCVLIYTIFPRLVDQLVLTKRYRQLCQLGVATTISQVHEMLCSFLSVTLEPYVTLALICEPNPKKRRPIRKSASFSIVFEGSSRITGDFLMILSLRMPLLVIVMLIMGCVALIGTYMFWAREMNEEAQSRKRRRDDAVERWPTHVESINMDAQAEWETSLKKREIGRLLFMTLTLAIALFFVCEFAEEDDILLWAKFLMKLQSILKTCSKISQRLPSARKIWRSMQESRPLYQIEDLMR
ncbi:hypothetical protein B0J13DRAFT_612840, partial [Dactylonectria estremocensis]